MTDVANPLLADNSGETRAHALPPGSPALDGGSAATTLLTTSTKLSH